MAVAAEFYLEQCVGELLAARWPGLLDVVCQAIDAERTLVVDAELQRRANGAVAAAVIPRPSTPRRESPRPLDVPTRR